MEKHIGITSIQYDEYSQESFKGITLSFGDQKKEFNSGDPLIDWYDYYKYIYSGEADKDSIFSIMCSSTVDHWFMDGETYVEKYLKYITENELDFMTSEEVMESFDNDETLIRCVAHKDMKSFKELKEYVKNNRVI